MSSPIARELLRVPPAYPGMTIGLLGGTFDPAHEGHVHVSETVLKRLGLDRLWWLVTPGNPLKRGRDTASFAARLAQARKLARHPSIVVTGFEERRPSVTTAATIGFLRRRFPATRFIWVMGADNLASFHHWAHWRDILRAVPVAVVDRPGARFAARAGLAASCFAAAYLDESDAHGLKSMRPPAWTLLSAPLSPLSSSELRARARTRR